MPRVKIICPADNQNYGEIVDLCIVCGTVLGPSGAPIHGATAKDILKLKGQVATGAWVVEKKDLSHENYDTAFLECQQCGVPLYEGIDG